MEPTHSFVRRSGCAIVMAVAARLGLLSAMYPAEYASARAWIKALQSVANAGGRGRGITAVPRCKKNGGQVPPHFVSLFPAIFSLGSPWAS
jgi:hypothetical protein